MRGLKLSGRALLGVSVALLLLFAAREWLRARWGIELLPLRGLGLLVASAAAVLLAPVAAALASRFGGPTLMGLARALDRRADARDLCAAALSVRGAAGPVAREVVRRAAERVGALDPEEVYPARRSLAKLAAVLPLALLAVYLLGLPPGAGTLPLGGGAGGGVAEGPGPTAAAPPATGETSSPDGEDVAPGAPERTDEAATPRADGILARVVPAKEVYGPKDPVTVFVQAKPAGELSRGRSLAVSVVVDGKEAPADATLAVGPAADAGAVAPVLLKAIPEITDSLGPGKHRVAAVLRDDAVEIRTPEVEIEIRGEPGGGGSPPPKPKPEPEPRPKPSGGEPPPPEVKPRPKFVVPLFREGETRKKEGWALVPDPEAPPGTPPRRVPLERAAREAGRRPESEVPVESLGPGDRALVRDYFDALREGK